MSGPGDTPKATGDKSADKSDRAAGRTTDEKTGEGAAEKSVTVTPAKVAHARSAGTGIPATPGHTGEPMDLKGTEPAAKDKPEAKGEKTDATTDATDTGSKVPNDKTPKGSKGSKEPPEKKPEEKKPETAKRRRGVVSWFFAGLGLAIAAVAGLASWNVWSEPHYVISPRLDALMQDYGGYVAAVTLFGLAMIGASLLRGRAAFVVTAGILILGVLVAGLTTVLLAVGAAIMCGQEPIFSQGAPDRRLMVIAVRGRCGVTREFTYRVSVRELGPSIPRQTMIFQSFGRPAPAEVVISQDRTISVLTESNNAEGSPRYTVTIDRKTFKPDKVWRFDARTD